MAASPQITKTMQVRSYVVKRDDGRWYAHCIDLTLDALAESKSEAVNKLNQEVIAYIEWALTNDLEWARPSPFEFRLRYYWYKLLSDCGRIIHWWNSGSGSAPATYQRQLSV